jgi:AcrR family transcriptional regulator
MAENSERQRYHHGDAHNALIASAEQLLERVGAAGLSLRQISEHAGLSRQAAYNHFTDKEALLAELVRLGFERLAADVKSAAGRDFGKRGLERAAESYIAFAQGSSAQFRLMFSRELVDLSRFPMAQAAAATAFEALAGVVAGFAPKAQVAELSLAAWCLVHGYATLCIETDLEPAARRRDRARLFAQIVRDHVTGAHGGAA